MNSALVHAPADGWRLVALAPERARWPLAGRVVGADALARLRDDLAPDGRCLAWLDTRDLDARALGARLAAFGAAFGARSLALVEPRELGAPLVLLVGWRADAGRPEASELAARVPTDWRRGVRPILDDAGDLACLLLFDGAGLEALAGAAPVQRAARPIPPGRGPTGWAALAAWERLGVEPGDAHAGWPAARATPWPLVSALAPFDRARFDPDRPAGTMSVQVAEDVDWAAFERLVEALAEVRRAHPEHPLLPVIAAALLEPLAVHREFTRFAWAWERLAADGLPGWRLPAMLAEVAGAMRQDELAAQAAERAKAWAAGRSSGH